MRRGKICYILEFLGVFLLVFGIIFFTSNFSVVYNLVYYYFQKSVPQNQGALFDYKNLENKIIIPKINVFAPIIFPKEDEENILDDLKKGVVYLPIKFDLIKQGSGIILGHSSRLLLNPGKYDIAFLFLSKLQRGDQIFIYFGNKKFDYRVINQEIVFSDDLSHLKFDQNNPILYLITCWPPGTNLKRLVVGIN